MKNYFLQTKTGETVSVTKQNDYSGAVSFFAKRKRISVKELLEIYKVNENENRGINR